MNFVGHTIYAYQILGQKLDFAVHSDVNSDMARWRKIRLDPEVSDRKFWALERLWKHQILEVEEQFYYTLHMNFTFFFNLIFLPLFLLSLNEKHDKF